MIALEIKGYKVIRYVCKLFLLLFICGACVVLLNLCELNFDLQRIYDYVNGSNLDNFCYRDLLAIETLVLYFVIKPYIEQ